MIIDELVAILGYDIRGEGNLKRFNAGLERAALLAQRMAVALAAAGVVAAGAMAALGKSVIETSAQFEGFETSLTTIEGSAEKAKQSMAWIQKFATQTPYDLSGVTEAFIKLKSYGLDPTDGTLKTLGDTASSMNKPLSAAVEMFADAATFEFERLKEFGLRAQQKGNEVTFTWTKNGKQMSKVVKKNSDDVRKFILQNLGERFNGAMIRQSKTWNGMMANLGDSWTNFKKQIGDGGFFENMKSRLANLLDTIGRFADDGTLQRWAQTISNGLTAVADFVGSMVGNIIRDIQQIADFISEHQDIFGPMKWAFLGLAAALFPVTALLAGAALALDDFLTYMRGGDSVIGDMVEWVSKIKVTFEDVKTAIQAIDWEGAGKTIGEGLVEGVKYAAIAIVGILTSIDWGGVVSVWIAALKAQMEFINGIFEGIGEAIGRAVLSGIQSIGGEIKAWFDSILPQWASEFFTWKGQKEGALTAKAKDEGKRRQDMEKLTTPYNPNLTLPEVYRNVQGNNAKIGAGAVQPVINDNSNRSVTTNTNVQLTVQQITEAATAAANAVRTKVSGALSGVSSAHPTRTTPSPTF
jgi:hypothetical protein